MSAWRGRRWRGIALIAAVAAAGAAAWWPMTTKQGRDFHITVRRIPLYEKTVDFFHRHWRYQAIAREITAGCRSDRERALAVYQWTVERIRPVPDGWPVVDDHILDIITRGYGTGDQMADVFTTLSTYAGVPAFWRAFQVGEGDGWLIVSFVRLEGRWAMFDVANQVMFADAHGRFLDAEALVNDPRLLPASFATKLGVVYQPYLARLQPFRVPAVLRAQKQMPWPRLWFEARRALRLVPDAAAARLPRAGGIA